MQTNIFPLYEIEDGTRYTLNYRGDRPVADYLQTQGRFKHLSQEDVAQVQEMVEEDWNNLLRKTDKMPP